MQQLTNTLFAVVLVCVVLRASTGEFESITALRLALLALGTVAVGAAIDWYRSGERAALYAVPLAIVLAGAAYYHVHRGGLPSWALFGTLGVIVTFAALQSPARERLPTLAPYLFGYTLFVGVFFGHVLSVSPTSGLARFPVFAAVVLALCLFVFPRYVTESAAFGTVALVSAAVVAIGLPASFGGPYTLWGMAIAPWPNGQFVPLVGEVPILRSVFPNPNTMGLLALAGTLAALITTHRTLARGSLAIGAGFALLSVLNAVGLYLSNSRAGMLAATAGAALYCVHVAVGRRSVPVALALVAGSVLAALVGIATVLPIDPGNRFTLWRAGVEAYWRSPLLTGHGLVGTRELIEPYTPSGFRTYTVHNSYLSILLRTGALGLAGYLLVVLGPLVHGALRYERVSVGALSLALAFAVHQLFEGYTLFQYGPGSVLGALALGYVLASLVPGSAGADERRPQPAPNAKR